MQLPRDLSMSSAVGNGRFVICFSEKSACKNRYQVSLVEKLSLIVTLLGYQIHKRDIYGGWAGLELSYLNVAIEERCLNAREIRREERKRNDDQSRPHPNGKPEQESWNVSGSRTTANQPKPKVQEGGRLLLSESLDWDPPSQRGCQSDCKEGLVVSAEPPSKRMSSQQAVQLILEGINELRTTNDPTTESSEAHMPAPRSPQAGPSTRKTQGDNTDSTPSQDIDVSRMPK